MKNFFFSLVCSSLLPLSSFASQPSALTDFVEIPAGSFKLTLHQQYKKTFFSNQSKIETRDIEIVIPRGFEMQTMEITQEQWYEMMKTTPWNGPTVYNSPRCDREVRIPTDRPRLFLCPGPATIITWVQAQTYIKKLNESQSEYTYRLPTALEYLYVSRPDLWDTDPYVMNLENLDEYAWTKRNSRRGHIREPGLKKPNAFGLYDIVGNVSELTEKTRASALIAPFGRFPKYHISLKDLPNQIIENLLPIEESASIAKSRATLFFGSHILHVPGSLLENWDDETRSVVTGFRLIRVKR